MIQIRKSRRELRLALAGSISIPTKDCKIYKSNEQSWRRQKTRICDSVAHEFCEQARANDGQGRRRNDLVGHLNGLLFLSQH